MDDIINANLEFFEVLNTFPILREKLSRLHFNISDVKEGESIKEYLGNRKRLEDFEINIIIKKLNREVSKFLTTSYNDGILQEYLTSTSNINYNFDDEEDEEDMEEEE